MGWRWVLRRGSTEVEPSSCGDRRLEGRRRRCGRRRRQRIEQFKVTRAELSSDVGQSRRSCRGEFSPLEQ